MPCVYSYLRYGMPRVYGWAVFGRLDDRQTAHRRRTRADEGRRDGGQGLRNGRDRGRAHPKQGKHLPSCAGLGLAVGGNGGDTAGAQHSGDGLLGGTLARVATCAHG